ncbi:MAG: thiamine phosphate synthase, partial [Gemmatimonadota bacterium]|nr:thiamine phosphate synthase [Gemmatimonadota bacterium]
LRPARLRRVDPDLLRLVTVTDEPGTDLDAWIARVASAVRGGATMVQVRSKKADPRTSLDIVKRLVSALPVPVVMNDRADIAIMAGAAGVHVGVDDVPVASIRSFAPPGFIIGASIGSRVEVEQARGADYIGIGPAFATSSKGDAGDPLSFAEIAELQALAGLPAVVIGGITPANVPELLKACPGVAGVAVVSSLFGADDVESAARLLRDAIGR